MATFPEYLLSETDKTKDDNKWGRQYIDAIVDYDNSYEQRTRVKSIQDNFDTYNGANKSKMKAWVDTAYGASSSTDFVTFHLARTKERLLLGEMLDIGMKSTVESINPEAINEKMKHLEFMTEIIDAKPAIEEVRKQTGMNVLNGMEIPDKGTKEAEMAMRPKRRNEMIMQRIIDKKLEEDKIKMKLYQDMIHLVLTSECHGIVEIDANGIDTYRVISPKHVIFQETPNDPFCLRTPFEGEKRLLYKHEIFTMFQDLNDEAKERIRKMGTSEGDPNEQRHYSEIDGQIAIWCYYCQWKSTRPRYVKVSKNKNSTEPSYYDITPEKYEQYKSGFDKGVERGEFTIDTKYKEDVWEGWRIGYGVYSGIQRMENQIQKVINGKARAYSTFVHCLYGTVDGKRISLEELIHELGDMHDLVMFIIKREIKKVKGKVYSYDEKYLPPRTNLTKMMYDVVEHGIIRFNSAVDGIPEDQVITAANLIQQIDLGLTQSFGILLELKRDIERTVDKITGINDEREGYSKASSTATGARQNIEASRSITKDLFFMHQLYASIMLTKMVDRTKLNRKYLTSMKGLFLDSDDISFLNSIRDLTMDDFAAYLTDGRAYNEIKETAMALFPQEINAGELHTKDVIRFKASQSLAEGLAVLDRAREEINKLRRAENESKMQSEQADREMKLKIAEGDREDWQAHEVQIERMKLQSKAGETMVNAGLKGLEQKQNQQPEEEDTNEYPPDPGMPMQQQQQPMQQQMQPDQSQMQNQM